MDAAALVGMVSLAIAGLTMAVGSIAPAIAQGRAVSTALEAIARQPDESGTVTRTLFVGLAMIESVAIYCLVIAMILIFANPMWNHFTQSGGGG